MNNNGEEQRNIVTSSSDKTSLKKNLVILCVVLFVFGILEIVSMSKAKQKANSNSQKTDEIKNENNDNQDTNFTYFKDLNIFTDSEMDEYGYFYNEDVITKDMITSKAKIMIALYGLTKNLDKSHPINFTKQQVTNKIETIFENNEYNDENVKVNCINFVFENGTYKGTPLSCNQNNDEKIVTKTLSVKNDENKIIIEEKMALLVNEENNIILYKSINKDKENRVDNLKIRNFNEFLIEQYQDNLYTYRWTFDKLDNSHYIFEKVEKVKNCSLEKMC